MKNAVAPDPALHAIGRRERRELRRSKHPSVFDRFQTVFLNRRKWRVLTWSWSCPSPPSSSVYSSTSSTPDTAGNHACPGSPGLSLPELTGLIAGEPPTPYLLSGVTFRRRQPDGITQKLVSDTTGQEAWSSH